MTDITLRSDIKIDLVDVMGSDVDIARAAWISTGKDLREDEEGRVEGFLNYLMKHRHGTPFEHVVIKVRAEAPIMVYREWHRHRIQSYNEQSGRYTTFLPHFYVPPRERQILNSGTAARPKFEGITDDAIFDLFTEDLEDCYNYVWKSYEEAIDGGIANEMARLVLPVATYSSMYATANLRAWLHFISLRTSEPEAHWQGHPQYEIVQAAKAVEEFLTEHFPLTMKAFVNNERVAP